MPPRHTSRASILAVAAALFLVPGCKDDGPVERAQAPKGLKRVELPAKQSSGLSGLGADAGGTLYAIPERDRKLVRITSLGAIPTVEELNLQRVEDPFELESVAALPGGKLLIGTEQVVHNRAEDRILLLEPHEGAYRVERTIPFSYALWRRGAPKNRGLEGICAVGDTVLVAGEMVLEEDGVRWAPLARGDITGASWVPFRVRLTSARGKLAGLSCRRGSAGIEAIAVERHFGVTRLLRFNLDPAAPAGDITAWIAADVQGSIGDGTNVEGVTWLPDGGVAFLNDNHYGMVTGPTLLFTLPPDALAPAPAGKTPAK